ncbi:hypothetical protein Tco_0992529 [Tanacetum coccineum]|uniref:Uncharacterized protein n=1 Tax=Tanacetum coccineum TaxID=301880 RepID=A0ABQ5F2I5_9ASTR
MNRTWTCILEFKWATVVDKDEMSVISSQHDVIPLIDDEETLILEEFNRLSEDFGKRFVLQQELSGEQAFWLQTSDPNSDQSDISPVKIEAPRKLSKCSVDKQCFKIHKKQLFLENDRLLHQIMSQDVMLCVMNSITVFGDSVNLEIQSNESCNKCLDLETELVKRKNMVERDVYTELSNSFAKLEKHCISLKLDIQLNQQIFQKDKSCDIQNALEIPEYFENNDLKAHLQAKDTTIRKLKEHIKSMRENDKDEKIKQDMDEIETINTELEHSVAKLLSENELLHKEIEHLKNIYKDQFDSIKKTHALSKEQCDSLIAQLNSKSMENVDLKGQIQENVFVTTTLQNELRRLKGKNVLNNASIITNDTTIAPGIFKHDLDHLAPRLLKNRDVHIDYLKYTQEHADILRGIVKQAKAKQPLDNTLDFAYVTPMNKVKKVRFSEPLTSSSNIHKKLKLSKTPDSNKLVLPSTGLKSFTSASRSQPTCNKKNDRISQTPSSNMKNKNNLWKPTGKVFTEVGYKWKPTGKCFNLVGNSCPLTRFTSANLVPPKETTSHSVETQKPKIKLYSRRPKQVKSVGSSKKAKILESKIANNLELNHSWGSNAIDVPSSSSLVNDMLSRLFSSI